MHCRDCRSAEVTSFAVPLGAVPDALAYFALTERSWSFFSELQGAYGTLCYSSFRDLW